METKIKKYIYVMWKKGFLRKKVSKTTYNAIFKNIFEIVWRNKGPDVETLAIRKMPLWRNYDPWMLYFSFYIFALAACPLPIRVQRIWLFLENEEYRPFDGCKIEI